MTHNFTDYEYFTVELPARIRRLSHFKNTATEMGRFVCLLKLWKTKRGIFATKIPFHWSQQNVLCQHIFSLWGRVRTPAVNFWYIIGQMLVYFFLKVICLQPFLVKKKEWECKLFINKTTKVLVNKITISKHKITLQNYKVMLPSKS